MPDSFIQKRLDSLNEIDSKIVSLLESMSLLVESYTSTDKQGSKQAVESQTKIIYQTLSDVAINLRKEVKVMDDNIGVFDKNEDNVMILPIPVDQKNTQLSKRKLHEEIDQLRRLIPEEATEDQKFHPREESEQVETKKELKDTKDVKSEPEEDLLKIETPSKTETEDLTKDLMEQDEPVPKDEDTNKDVAEVKADVNLDKEDEFDDVEMLN